jgi:16S rRNA processing protein RimM
VSSADSERSSKPRQRAKAPASTSTSSEPASDAVGSSAPPPEAQPHDGDLLVVAQVLSAHGIRGELKCRIVTDFPKQRFKRGNSVLLDGSAHTVRSARIEGHTVLLKLADIADRDAAAAYRGKDVLIRSEDAVKLPEGEFYWHQVIGLTVIDTTTRRELGQVADILETGANDVYVVKTANGKEVLIPAIKDVIHAIEPDQGRILVTPLPGMITP